MPVREIKAGYSNVTGKYPSIKMNRAISFESTLERDFYLLLDHENSVDFYEEQPRTIKYKHLSKNRTYTPDTLVRRLSESQEDYTLYEIKYRSDLFSNWMKLKPKFKAAIRFCNEQNWKFKIMTEVEIRTPRLKNLEFLDHFRSTVSQNEDAIRQALLESMLSLQKATPQELIAVTFSDFSNRAEALPVLWRMIVEGGIGVNLDCPLDMNSPLFLEDSEYA
ncbi:MAG: heteromeric transposase endonuclease subunit TnsA [Oleiphilus sp.]|nr:MAG: heteromeric transposase endonuclease subunit TnsA [Oleiphilus sp.]